MISEDNHIGKHEHHNLDRQLESRRVVLTRTIRLVVGIISTVWKAPLTFDFLTVLDIRVGRINIQDEQKEDLQR